MNFARLGNTGTILGILGLAACAVCFAVAKETFYSSYLFAYMFWISLTLGCLGLAKLHHTVRGSWGLAVLRLFEAGASPMMFVIFAILFAPILYGMGDIYHHWMHPEAGDMVLAHKAAYLNQKAFILRGIGYFVVWIGFASFFRSSSRKQDETKDASLGALRSSVGAGSLIAFVLTLTFAITDWVMSLDPHWYSTIYGFLFVVYSALAALSLVTFIVTRYANAEPYSRVVTPALQKDLGNLMFMFTMLWGYMTLSQFLIIWSGNLPELTPYFATRNMAGWNILGAFNVFTAFFVPWLTLLSPRVKRNTNSLMWVAVLVFLMRIPDWYWVIIPFFRHTFAWTDAVTFVALGAVWFAIFGREAAQVALLPSHDERLVEAKRNLEAHHVGA